VGINFDRIADIYDDTRGGSERGAASAGVVLSYLPPHRPLIEIGVGTGLVAQAIGPHVIGIDISTSMLGRARRRLGPCVVLGDAGKLPFGPNTFAGGYGVWVLHLVADQRAVLAEVARVLRPASNFVIEPTITYSAPGDPAQQILDRLYALVRPRRDTEERIRALATSVGLGVSAVASRTSVFEESPAHTIAMIEARSGAAFWDLTTDEWTALVEPSLASLRALPVQDLPRRSGARTNLAPRPPVRRRRSIRSVTLRPGSGEDTTPRSGRLDRARE